jgi:hypothetical protein
MGGYAMEGSFCNDVWALIGESESRVWLLDDGDWR